MNIGLRRGATTTRRKKASVSESRQSSSVWDRRDLTWFVISVISSVATGLLLQWAVISEVLETDSIKIILVYVKRFCIVSLFAVVTLFSLYRIKKVPGIE